MSRIADLLIEHGPYAAGDVIPLELKEALGMAAPINELRDELIRLRNDPHAASTPEEQA